MLERESSVLHTKITFCKLSAIEIELPRVPESARARQKKNLKCAMANGSMPNVVHAGPKMSKIHTQAIEGLSRRSPSSFVERGWGTRIEIQKCERQKRDCESENED